MKSLAIIALLIGGTSPVLAQNAPPADGYPPPAAGAAGNPAMYGPPGSGVILGAPGPPFHSTVPRYTSRAALIAPVYSHHHRQSHHYIVIPLTRDYGWWPQGQYRWFPFGPARWGYWCEPADYHRLSCGVGD